MNQWFRRKRLCRARVALCVSMFFLSLNTSAIADDLDDLLDTDLADLVDVEIHSATRSDHQLFDTAAAVFVLTEEDIRRSSANSIPELLRLVPGLDVAKNDSNTWAISARGFQTRYNNKMLVMVDGQSVYTIGFGGVRWETLTVPLTDIKQIEVVRGPGGSVWDTNAVNGVVNIITKNAHETAGWHLQTGTGNKEQGFGTVSYSGEASDKTSYRLSAGGASHENEREPTSLSETASDEWANGYAGIRVDSQLSDTDTFMFQLKGFAFDGEGISRRVNLTPPANLDTSMRSVSSEGGTALAKWSHQFSGSSLWEVQGYVDAFSNDGVSLSSDVITYDLDVQNSWSHSDSYSLISGVNTRLYDHSYENGYASIDSPNDEVLFVDFFFNNEIKLGESVDVYLGSKVGRNDFTGWEYQPSARTVMEVSEDQRLWFAVSRAVRVPDRIDDAIEISTTVIPSVPPSGLPGQTVAFGNSSLDAEDLLAYEAGYRLKADHWLYLDLAFFYNEYDDVIGFANKDPFLSPDVPPSIVIPLELENGSEVQTFGGEVLFDIKALDSLRLLASYSYLKPHVDRAEGVVNIRGADDDGFFVQNKASLRSLWSLTESLEFDSTVRYVDSIPTLSVPAYVAYDVRFGWHLSDSVELSLIGQNIFDSGHAEHNERTDETPFEIERSFFWQLDVQL